MSEISAGTLGKAYAIHPLTNIQSEYSPRSREPEDEVLQTCKEPGITFVAYSPPGRGFLTAQIKSFEDFAPDDYSRTSPRFMGEMSEKP